MRCAAKQKRQIHSSPLIKISVIGWPSTKCTIQLFTPGSWCSSLSAHIYKFRIQYLHARSCLLGRHTWLFKLASRNWVARRDEVRAICSPRAVHLHHARDRLLSIAHIHTNYSSCFVHGERSIAHMYVVVPRERGRCDLNKRLLIGWGHSVYLGQINLASKWKQRARLLHMRPQGGL